MIDPETGEETSSDRPSKLGIALRRFWPVMLLVAIVFGVLAYIGSKAEQPSYSATGQVFVSEGNSNNAVTDVQTVAALMTSDAVVAQVARATGLSFTVVSARLSATPVPGTNVVALTATGHTPAATVRLVNAANTAFKHVDAGLPAEQFRRTYMPRVQLPSSPTAPRPTRNGGLGFVLGLLLSVGFFWLREIRRPTAADTALVVGSLGVPMFADLTAGRRSRRRAADAYVALSLDLDELAPRGTRVLCLGAVNDTDLDVNLVVGLARAFVDGGWRITIVDAEREGRVSTRLGAGGRRGLSDLIERDEPVEGLLVQIDNSSSLTLLPIGKHGFDTARPNLSAELRRVFSELTRSADLVLVNVPNLGKRTEARLVAAAAEGVVLVITESTAVASIEFVRDRLGLFKANLIGFVRDSRHRRLRRRSPVKPDTGQRQRRPGKSLTAVEAPPSPPRRTVDQPGLAGSRSPAAGQPALSARSAPGDVRPL